MNVFKKFVCLFLAMLLTFSMVPLNVFAQDSTDTQNSMTEIDGDVYTIRNDYVKYSINKVTGAFSIETLDGNPQKKLDDNLPLLFRETIGEESLGTSFTTVRINGRDYIFGRDYSNYGIETKLETPVVQMVNNNPMLTVKWTIMGYEVIQQVALSADNDNDLTGNVGMHYSVTNTTSKDGKVGIRVLLDVALDSTDDAPYLLCDTDGVPLQTEVKYEGANVPKQIRGVDSVNAPTKMLYAFTNPMQTNEELRATSVIIGHWRNLANTRYTYTPDRYCDFTNYSNQHQTPDAAIAFYWDEAVLAAGGKRQAEFLYGVGNFSSSLVEDNIGLGIVINEKIREDENNPGKYENNGIFTVTVNLDNTVTGAKQLKGGTMTLSCDDGITVLDGGSTQVFDTIAPGYNASFAYTLQVDPQETITGLDIGVTLSAYTDEGEDSEFITVNAQKTLIVPGLGGPAPITLTSIAPKTVYTEGTKTLTLIGELAPLYAAISGASDKWSMYLYHTTSDHTVEIDRADVAFLNDAKTMLSVTTDEELVVGDYEIGFTFTDTQLVGGYGMKELRFDKTFRVSNDEVYKTRSFGLVALIRYDTAKYTYVPFAEPQEYEYFMDGKTITGADYDFETNKPETSGFVNMDGDPIAPAAPVDTGDHSTMKVNDYEIILIMRGAFHEILDENNKFSHYQASPDDGDILINEILTYKGSNPMTANVSSDRNVFKVSGNGKLQVVSSIDVWKGKWSYLVNNGTVTSLDSDFYDLPESSVHDLELTLGGVGYMVQSLGGFLIDMKYGVMGSSRSVKNDRELLYSIDFGGSLSLPIIIPSSKKEQADNAVKNDGGALDQDYSQDFENLFADDDQQFVPNEDEKEKKESFRKDTNLDDAALGIAIDSVLFGQEEDNDGKKDVGFIGIDTTVSVGLPKDTLGKLVQNAPGVRASVTINTIDHFYMLEAGLDIKAIQCEGVLSFAMTDVKGHDVVIPDSIQFYIRDGLKIPIAPPVLFISGLGGGLDGIADTIGGEFETVPPLTLLLFMRLDLVEVLMGDFSAEIALSGISLDGELSVNVAGLVKNKKEQGDNQGGDQGGDQGGTNQGGTTGDQGGTKPDPDSGSQGSSGGVGSKDDDDSTGGNAGSTVGGDKTDQGTTGDKPEQGGGQGGTTGDQGGTGTGTGGTDANAGKINGAKDSPLNPANVTTFATSILDYALSPVSIKFGASARWIDPICFTAYGKVSVIGGLLTGGISVTITDESFCGYAYLSLCIPESVPIVGGYELAGVEASITDKFLGANLKIIGIKIGFIYYWNGDFNFGTGINIRSGAAELNYPAYASNAVYATNLARIPVTSVPIPMTRAAVVNGKTFDIPAAAVNGNSLVLEIPYTWSTAADVNSITVTNPDDKQITLIADDEQGGGSFLVQHTEKGSTMYVSITDKNLIKEGTWTVTVNESADGMTLGEIGLYNVENIPELNKQNGITFTRGTDVSSTEFDVSWTLDGTSAGTGTIDIYLTKDKTVLEQLKKEKTTEHDLTRVGSIALSEMKSGSGTITIPEAFESGEYYVVAMLTHHVGGMSTAISADTFTFVNKNLPASVERAYVSYAGDGELFVEVVDADTVDYTDYLVDVYEAATDENGSVVPGAPVENTMRQYSVGEYIYVGGEEYLTPGKQYFVGIRTLNEDNVNNKFFYGSDIVYTTVVERDADGKLITPEQPKPITMPEISKPVLVSVETNLGTTDVNGIYSADDYLEITYTFDRPVWMYAEVNQITMYAVDDGKTGDDKYYKNTWTFRTDLPDGDYTVDFVAYGRNKDSVTGQDFPNVTNARMGFTVDATAPALSIKQYAATNVAGERTVIASSVVYANEDGAFVIEGFTDQNASLTANGQQVSVNANGTFAYAGTLDDGESEREILFIATDPAGNESRLKVTVSSAVGGDIADVALYYNGEKITDNTVKLINGASGTLTLVAVTASGETVTVIEDPVWEILSERENITFNNGAFTAVADGETAIKASVVIGSYVDNDGKTKELCFEDYVILNIARGSKQTLADAIAAAEDNLAEAQTSAPTAAVSEYSAAIEAAKAILDNAQATDEQINDAIRALGEATAAFDAVKVVDKSTLEAAIEAAEENIANTGNATEREITTYRTAIEAAKAVLAKQGVSQAEITEAVSTLKRATNTFTTAKNRVPYIPVTQYSITLKDTTHGTATVSQRVVYEGTSLTITATPDKGYAVESVKVNGRDFGAYETITIAGVYSNLTIEVTFKLTWQSPYIDVDADDWFYPYVAWASLNDITKGTSENTFSPDVALTRSMLVTFLWRAEGCPTAENASAFADVAEDAYYGQAVAWAAENGIVYGYPDGTFGPDDMITREQIAVILYRTANLMGYEFAGNETKELSEFADEAAVSAYAVEGMRWAVEAGIIIGSDQGMLEPLGDATRAESVTILSRFYENSK